MTKTACQYKIVRFAPFAETEEFANVGIVLFEPKAGELRFELARKRFARVTQFFDLADDRGVFSGAIDGLREELQRLQEQLQVAKSAFDDFTRLQSGLIHFSEPRVIRADDLDKTTRRLFKHYVEREFHSKRYREEVLAHELRETFKQYELTRLYHERQLETELYPVKMPLAYLDDGCLRGAIKPLAFDQKTVQGQVDHLDRWVSRVEHLRRSGVNPDALMFAFDEASAQSKEVKAYIRGKRQELDRLRVHTADVEDVAGLIQYARERVAVGH